jgi:hypothetical protein
MKSLLFLVFAALTLSSCTAITGFLATDLGKASLFTVETLGKHLAKVAEKQVLEQIITKAAAKVTSLNAQGINSDLAKEILRKSEIAFHQEVYEAAQVQYFARTGARFILPATPKNPVAKVTP